MIDFVISPNSASVVYLADQDEDDTFEIYSCPIDGSAAPIKLNGPLVANGNVRSDAYGDRAFKITADSTMVVYRADQDVDSVYEVYARPLDGSGAPVRLSRAQENSASVDNPADTSDDIWEFVLSPDSQWVVFMERSELDDLVRLYSRPIDASAAAHQLSGNAFEVTHFRVSPASERVVFNSDEGGDTIDLYSRPINGSSAAIKENGTLAGYAVTAFAIAPDGQRLVYVANQDVPGDSELWSSIRCGDAIPDAGESCDDGNATDGDCCSPLCQPISEGATCGLGLCAAQVCSAGVCGGGAIASCGDGIVGSACNERCDDGGTSAGDGCDASCQLEDSGRKCLQSIGLQARRIAAQDFKLTQGCFADIARGYVGCQSNLCVLRASSATPMVVSGSTCTTAADCCPAFDSTTSSKTTAAKQSAYAAKAAQKVRKACSLAKGTDGAVGTDDDTYIDPQTFGFAAQCPDTFGQCGSISAATLQSARSANDLLECTQCMAASTSFSVLKFHYPLSGTGAAAVACQKAIGVHVRKLANAELTSQQQCLDDVASGELSCQSNQCKVGLQSVAGSSCADAADCCPAYDSVASSATTQADFTAARSDALQAIRSACSTDKGSDQIKGTDDDVYVDPQTLGYAAACMISFGQCGGDAISEMTASGAANDLLECVTCSIGSAADGFSRVHVGAP